MGLQGPHPSRRGWDQSKPSVGPGTALLLLMILMLQESYSFSEASQIEEQRLVVQQKQQIDVLQYKYDLGMDLQTSQLGKDVLGVFTLQDDGHNASAISDWPITYQALDANIDDWLQEEDAKVLLADGRTVYSRKKKSLDMSLLCLLPCPPGCPCINGICICQSVYSSCSPSLVPAHAVIRQHDGIGDLLVMSCNNNYELHYEAPQVVQPFLRTNVEGSSEVLLLSCSNGLWLPDPDHLVRGITQLSCRLATECTIQCLNGGFCIAPRICQCPSDFLGDICQFQLGDRCREDLSPLIAGDVERRVDTSDPNKYHLSCSAGYEFSDGTIQKEVICAGSWILDGVQTLSGLTSPLSCKAQCLGKCGHGVCINPGTCECPVGYTGPQCSIVVCGEELPEFVNGRIVLDVTQLNMATFTCDPGSTVEYPYPNMASGVMTCFGGKWYFEMNFVYNMTVTQLSGSSAMYEFNHSSLDSGFSLMNVWASNFSEFSGSTLGETADGAESISLVSGVNPFIFVEPEVDNYISYFVDDMNAGFNSILSSGFSESSRSSFSNTIHPLSTLTTFEEGKLQSRSDLYGNREPSPVQSFDSSLSLSAPYSDLIGPQSGVDYLSIDIRQPVSCLPACDRRCKPYGDCTSSTEGCICREGAAGEMCEIRSCKMQIPQVTFGFSQFNSGDLSSATVWCHWGYRLPIGGPVSTITCENHIWQYRVNSVQETTPLVCKPICDMGIDFNLSASLSYNADHHNDASVPNSTQEPSIGCLNGGMCIGPNMCLCPSEYTGQFCDQLACQDVPAGQMMNVDLLYEEPYNQHRRAIINCTNSDQVVTLQCVNGDWFEVSQEGSGLSSSEFVPSLETCPRVCPQPCLNGGECTLSGTCLCPAGYSGSDCSVRPCLNRLPSISFGTIHTNYIPNSNGSSGQHSLRCNAGYIVVGSSASHVSESGIICSYGRWVLEVTGNALSEDLCQPHCPESCLNGGTCSLPGTCECPGEFFGDRCQNRRCITKPGEIVSESNARFYLTCPIGTYIHSTIRSTVVECLDGKFRYPDTAPGFGVAGQEVVCREGCPTPCKNGGVCGGIDTCLCTRDYEGQHCEYKKCPALPNLTTATLNLTTSRQGELTCGERHTLREGGSVASFVCASGVWTIEVAHVVVPIEKACEKACERDCLNGGTCVAKDTCSCQEGFNGPICELEVCDLIVIENGKIELSSRGWVASCIAGYFFASGRSSATAICAGGAWTFPGESTLLDQTGSYLLVPTCSPGCPEGCLNGGVCVGVGRCDCVGEYVGDRCQEIGCSGLLPTITNGFIQTTTESTRVECSAGFILPPEFQEGLIYCHIGDWRIRGWPMPIGEGQITGCVRACDSPCLNGGTCVGGTTQCQCLPELTGHQCQHRACADPQPVVPPPAVESRALTSDVYPFTRSYTCPERFFFRSGARSLTVSCQEGMWVMVKDGSSLKTLILEGDTVCTEGCPGGCGIGGTCAGPSTCLCDEGFEGHACEKPACSMPSPNDINGNIMLNEDGNRVLVCHPGYHVTASVSVTAVFCVDGLWRPSTSITQATRDGHVSCLPTCQPECLNGGTCSRPGKCSCPERFSGPACEDNVCLEPPPQKPERGIIFQESPSSVTYMCEEGYRFVAALAVVTFNCTVAGWRLKGNGQEVSIADASINEWMVCEKIKTCLKTPPEVKNAGPVLLSSNTSPVLRCHEGYRLQSGETEIRPSCVDGEWVITVNEMQGCNPYCPYGCLSGGICVGPGVCRCPAEYGGISCQEKRCLQPINGNNISTVSRDSRLFAHCAPGYLFENHETYIELYCHDGQWVYPGHYHELGRLVCVPICVLGCENGGTCIGNEICACLDRFSGDRCEVPVECTYAMPALPNTVTENVGSGIYRVQCNPGYAFNNSVLWLELRCQQSLWSFAGYSGVKAVPQCHPTSGRLGKLCQGVQGQACGITYNPECSIEPPSVANATVTYNVLGGLVNCSDGYALATGAVSTPFKCLGSFWSYPDCDTDDPPVCRPVCRVSCRNGGICSAPVTCTCQPGYTGPLCGQKVTEPCTKPPIPVPNAAVHVSFKGQFMVCAKGFQFQSGRVREEIWCKNGEWMFPTKSTRSLARSCYPICSGGCINGGMCVGPEECSCVHPFTGRRCEMLDHHLCWSVPARGENIQMVYNSSLSTSQCYEGYSLSQERTWNQSCSAGRWSLQIPPSITGYEINPLIRPSEFGVFDPLQLWGGVASSPIFEGVDPGLLSVSERNCTPVCEPLCLNGGICFKPNECICPENFSGPRCNEAVAKNCSDLPDTVSKGYIHYRYPEREATVQCIKGHQLLVGITRTTLLCSDGLWYLVWLQNALNASETSISSADWIGNSRLSTASFGSGASFSAETIPPFVDTRVRIPVERLTNPASSSPLTALSQLPPLACQPVCQKPCLNNGTCVGPEQCQCTDGFAGDQCQLSKCAGAPQKIRNSVMIFSKEYLSGVSRCRSGFRLHGGDTAARFVCRDGVWRYVPEADLFSSMTDGSRGTSYGQPFTSSQDTSPVLSDGQPLQCFPVCSRPCLNGGWCVAPETCRCTEGFYGDQCHMRYSVTLNGSRCVFPFTYRDVKYYGCTGTGHSRPWCATAVTATGRVTAWDVCIADLGLKKVVVTEDGKVCSFPFVYHGREYHRCTTTERGRGWCATSLYQGIIATWSFCDPDQGGESVAITTEGRSCQLPFSYGGRVYPSCVQDQFTPWCVVEQTRQPATTASDKSLTYESMESELKRRRHEERNIYGVCLSHWGHQRVRVTRDGRLCVLPFHYQGQWYHSCAYNVSASRDERLWCATKVSSSGGVLQLGFCNPEADMPLPSNIRLIDVYPHLNTVYPPHHTVTGRLCALPFKHQDLLHTTCTTTPIAGVSEGGSPTRAWCATLLDVDDYVIEYDVCEQGWEQAEQHSNSRAQLREAFYPPVKETLVSIVTVSGHNCSLPFLYRGLVYHGCVTDEAGTAVRPWCAVLVAKDGTLLQTEECPPDWDRDCPPSVLDHGASLPNVALMPLDSPPAATIFTESGAPCILPFIHLGRSRSTCVEDTRPWCPTKLDPTGAALAWDYCLDATSDTGTDANADAAASRQAAAHLMGDVQATVQGLRCVFPFTYLGETYHSCTAVGGDRPWCATEVDITGTPTAFDNCALREQFQNASAIVMTQSGHPCIFPFFYRNHQFSSCTTHSMSSGHSNKREANPTFKREFLMFPRSEYDNMETSMSPNSAGRTIPDVNTPLAGYDASEGDVRTTSLAQLANRLSEIRLDNGMMEGGPWCAVAVDHDGEVTMKSECLGSFEIDSGQQIHQETTNGFATQKNHDLNLMERFLLEDEAEEQWQKLQREPKGPPQAVSLPTQNARSFMHTRVSLHRLHYSIQDNIVALACFCYYWSGAIAFQTAEIVTQIGVRGPEEQRDWMEPQQMLSGSPSTNDGKDTLEQTNYQRGSTSSPNRQQFPFGGTERGLPTQNQILELLTAYGRLEPIGRLHNNYEGSANRIHLDRRENQGASESHYASTNLDTSEPDQRHFQVKDPPTGDAYSVDYGTVADMETIYNLDPAIKRDSNYNRAVSNFRPATLSRSQLHPLKNHARNVDDSSFDHHLKTDRSFRAINTNERFDHHLKTDRSFRAINTNERFKTRFEGEETNQNYQNAKPSANKRLHPSVLFLGAKEENQNDEKNSPSSEVYNGQQKGRSFSIIKSTNPYDASKREYQSSSEDTPREQSKGSSKTLEFRGFSEDRIPDFPWTTRSESGTKFNPVPFLSNFESKARPMTNQNFKENSFLDRNAAANRMTTILPDTKLGGHHGSKKMPYLARELFG